MLSVDVGTPLKSYKETKSLNISSLIFCLVISCGKMKAKTNFQGTITTKHIDEKLVNNFLRSKNQRSTNVAAT